MSLNHPPECQHIFSAQAQAVVCLQVRSTRPWSPHRTDTGPPESEACLLFVLRSAQTLLPVAPPACPWLHRSASQETTLFSPHENRGPPLTASSSSPVPPLSASGPFALTGNAVSVLPSDLRVPAVISFLSQREAWGPVSSAPAWSRRKQPSGLSGRSFWKRQGATGKEKTWRERNRQRGARSWGP